MNESFYPDLFLLAQFADNQSRDLLVAIVAIGLGLNILYAAFTNNERCFDLASVRLLERNLGRSYARLILVGVGSVCVFLGVYLVAQSAVRKSASNNFGDVNLPIAGAAAELN